MSNVNIPEMSDVILHDKDGDRNERITFPVTRYANVIAAPRVVREDTIANGAPFHLLVTKTESMDISVIRELCGDIL